MRLEEEFFQTLIQNNGIKAEDFAGKHCAIVGGEITFGVKPLAEILREYFLEKGAKGCDNIPLFNSHGVGEFVDLSGLEKHAEKYDYIVVLSGMEKTRDILRGVAGLKHIAKEYAKLLLFVRTPEDISTKYSLTWYEDFWRFERADIFVLFPKSFLLFEASSKNPGFLAMLLEISHAEIKETPLFSAVLGRRILPSEVNSIGYFEDKTKLDVIGVEARTDKCSLDHNYLNKYEFFLNRFKEDEFNLLELGVFHGSSLRMWQEYFSKAQIYGVDIMEHAKSYEDERIHIFIRDLSQENTLEELKKINPKIIIDDASHITSHQILALFTLFDVLPSGGIYILEDMETSANPELFGGFIDTPISAYDVCRRICDIVMRKAPKHEGIYDEEIYKIGMQTEMISMMKGSCILIKK